MKALSRTLLAIIGLVLILTPSAFAQKQTGKPLQKAVVASNESAGAIDRNRETPDSNGVQLDSLLKRRSALKRYLLSVSPASKDYQVTENAIREVDVKIQNLKDEIGSGSLYKLDNHKLVAASSGQSKSSAESGLAEKQSPLLPNKSSQISRSLTNHRLPVVQVSEGADTLNSLLNDYIRAKIDQTHTTKQTETPSASENTTSLVDQSSASDLIGVAMNLAGLQADTDDNAPEADSFSATASAYALYAAAKGVDPLNPIFYNNNHAWRRVFITLGYDDEKQEGTETTDRAKTIGLKYLFVDKRDPSLYKDEISKLFGPKGDESGVLADATKKFGLLYAKVVNYLFKQNVKVKDTIIKPEFKQFLEGAKATASAADVAIIDDLLKKLESDEAYTNELFLFNAKGFIDERSSIPERRYYVTFKNKYLGKDIKEKLGEDVIGDIYKHLDMDDDIEAFARLDETARELIEKIRKAPQLSFYVLTKQREIGANDYMGELIFDYGLHDRVNLTMNGAFNYVDSKIIGGDTRGGTFAGQLQFRLNSQPESLTGKKPFYFYLATNNEWLAGRRPTFMGQAKLTIPIADGFDIPLSFVYASQTKENNRNIVKGQFAFTFDTARLLRAFLSR